MKWTLESTVKYFAIFQIVVGVFTLLSLMIKIDETTITTWSSPIVEIGLASWVMHAGVGKKQLPPIMNFAFAQFLLAVKSGIDNFIPMVYYFAKGTRFLFFDLWDICYIL